MRDTLTRTMGRAQRSFGDFTLGQKLVAVIGTGALLLAGFMVFRWVATPSYTPLYSGLASGDASAIVDKLESQGVPYQLANGGDTIMVPREDVYSTRISLSGEGLPSGGDKGYSLLDKEGLSTSQFQEQTSFKRAMEGELSHTIEAIDGVETAVVHLALPPRQVFADEQDPATASVLVKTASGSTLDPEQVQAVVNLVSSSIDGLDPEKVTVADSTGKVLSTLGGGAGEAATQSKQVQDFQTRMVSQVQSMLDQVVGPGNSAVQITPVLDFDKSVQETTRYFGKPLTRAESTANETLTGEAAANAGQTGGIVGPESQMDPDAAAAGADGDSYQSGNATRDFALNQVVERREAAPGGVESLHVSVVLDAATAAAVDPAEIQTLVGSGLGIDAERGDTIQVSSLPFDRTAQEAAAAELEAAAAAGKKAETMQWIRSGVLLLLGLIVAFLAWWRARKRAKARAEATTYVVEQLRRDALDRQAAAIAPPPAMAALESADAQLTGDMREEIAALVERQPEDVAALLRGWLVEPR